MKLKKYIEYQNSLLKLGKRFCPMCKAELMLENFSRNGSKSATYCKRCCRVIAFKIRGKELPEKSRLDPPAPCGINNKICSKCKRELDKRMFYVRLGSKDGLQAWCKECWQNNNRTASVRLSNKGRYEKNKVEIRKHEARRRKNDLKFRLRHNLKQSFKKFIANKSGSFSRYIGCSIEDFKKHIEEQFESWMSWENYANNNWHLDHIIPQSAFNPFSEEESMLCWNYRNFQPLSAKENIRKSGSVQSSKIYLVRKIEKLGSDEVYQRMLSFIDSSSQPNT